MRKKITKKTRKEFFKQKKTIQRLVILAGLILAVLANMVVGYIAMDEPLNSFADDVIQFKQDIRPFDPVEKSQALMDQDIKIIDFKSSGYRILTPIGKEDENDSRREGIKVKNPVATFSGNALYPNSQIILEVQSKKFYTTVVSDSAGRWEWTNYAHPLEEGEHSIKMYNISPYEISGKRDIFRQGYSFKVDLSGNQNDSENIYLANADYGHSDIDDLDHRLINGNAENMYYFDLALLHKSEFNPDDNVDLQLIFSPLDKISPVPARIKYRIYSADNQDSDQTVLVSAFEDNVLLEGSKAFLKTVNLKDKVVFGNYILKVTAIIGESEYVQSVRFHINSSPIIQVGSVTVTEDRFRKIIVANTLVFGIIIIIIIILIIFEYGRFWVYGPIDESVLRRKGYFG